MMTRAGRLKKLGELEERLQVRPKPRVYLRRANTGEWYGHPPPPEGPRPGDMVISVVFMTPNGEHGGRPVTAAELAARREACRPAAADEGTGLSPGGPSGFDRG